MGDEVSEGVDSAAESEGRNVAFESAGVGGTASAFDSAVDAAVTGAMASGAKVMPEGGGMPAGAELPSFAIGDVKEGFWEVEGLRLVLANVSLVEDFFAWAAASAPA